MTLDNTPPAIKKQLLHRSGFTNFFGYLAILLFSLSCFGLFSFWLAPISLILIVLLEPFSPLWLTNTFLQKGRSKLIMADITDVRQYSLWYIVVDRYGDTIWIPMFTLTPTSKSQLLQSLAFDQNTAEQGAAANP